MPKKFLKTELKKSAFSDQCSVLCAACVASVGEQPEPGEEKIIRSHRDIIIRSQRDIFTFAAGSRNNGHERQCGIWGKTSTIVAAICTESVTKQYVRKSTTLTLQIKTNYIFTFLPIQQMQSICECNSL